MGQSLFVIKKSKSKALSTGKKAVISKEILKNITREKIDYTYDIIDLNC